MGSAGSELSFSPAASPDAVWVGSGAPTLSDRLVEISESHSAKTALTYTADGADRSVTYAEIDAMVSRTANALRGRLEPGSRVAILIDDPLGHLAAVFGAYRSGMVAVPLDPANPPSRLQHIVEHSGAAAVLTDEALRDAAGRIGVGRLLLIEDTGTEAPRFDGAPVDPGSTAQIMYTSGSTGAPKGVVHSHRYLMEKAKSVTAYFGLSETDRLSQLFPLSFAASNGHTFGAFLNGGTLLPYDIATMGIHHLADWVSKWEITGLAGVPTLFRRAFADLNDPQAFRALRFVMVGGEPVLSGDQALFRRLIPEHAVMVHQLAATESGAIARNAIARDTPQFQTVIPAGYPTADKEVLIVDEGGRPIPDGEVGELWVRSRYLSDGYWADEALTSKVFSEGPDGIRTYRTGDLARKEPDGSIVYLGRRDDRIKVRGFGVDLVEVESVFVGLQGVSEGAVKAFDSDSGDARLVGYFVGEPDLRVAELRTRMAESVPDYMIPSAFVRMESMPLTPRGKIDRKALPDPAAFTESMDKTQPTTDLERKLHALWSRILGVDDVGVNESFFDLGGSSIQAYELIADIYGELGVDLPSTSLLEASTIRRQAELIGSGDADEASALVPIRPSGPQPPLFGFHAMFGDVFYMYRLAEHLPDDIAVYGLRAELNAGERTVEEMAIDYLAEIRSVQPTSPYRLFGFCFGGLVAREIGRILEEEGERVELLMAVDPPTPGDKPKVDQNWTWLRVRRGLVGRYRKWRRKVRNLFARREVVERRRRLRQVHGRARAAYRPKPSGVPFLVVAEEGAGWRHRRNWEPVSRGGLEVVEFPAFHSQMLKPDNLQAIAEIVVERLASLDSSPR